MKKIFLMMMAVGLVMSISACGGKTEDDAIRENKTDQNTQETKKDSKKTPKYAVGDIITMGEYEQDNNLSNGAEPIEWRVLDVQDGKVLVISKYGLDAKPFNETLADVKWENCTLREWLNDDFFNTAFNDVEKKKIPTVTVTADINPYADDVDPGNDTEDNIFLLSTVEAEKYFESNGDRVCRPTDYAIANGVTLNKEGVYNCWWWLRSSGGLPEYAWRVHYYGDLEGSAGHSVDTDFFAVRPAMWIDTKTIYA